MNDDQQARAHLSAIEHPDTLPPPQRIALATAHALLAIADELATLRDERAAWEALK